MVQGELAMRARTSIMRMEDCTRRTLARFEQRLQLKRKAGLGAIAGLCLPLLALLLFLIDPVAQLGRMYMSMSAGHHGYKLWERPPVGAYARMFLFNVTNAEEFLSGEHASLHVQEIGPFTYLENRTNSNMTLDWEKGLLRFVPHTELTFLPELSIGYPEDFNLTVPNLALLTTASMLDEYPFWTTIAFNLLVANLGTTPFKHITAHEYMWGFEDKLVEVAHTVLPGWINTPKLGILMKLYEDPGEEIVEVELQAANRYKIRSWSGHAALPQWADSEQSGSSCNHLNGSYEGLNYSPGFTINTTFPMYRRQACRTVPMVAHSYDVTDYGIPVLLFSPSRHTFDPNPENDCMCKKGRCLLQGMSDLSPCYMGMSFAISRPHCLYCEAAAFRKVEGLRPDPLLHETTIAIEPIMGFPLRTTSSSQSNLVVRDVSRITIAHRFSNIVLPMFWMKLDFQELPDDLKTVLRLRFTIGPALLVALEILLVLGGVAASGYNVYRYLRPRSAMQYEALPRTNKELEVFVHENPLMDDLDP